MSGKVDNNLNAGSINQTADIKKSTMGDTNIKQANVDSLLHESPQKVDQNKGLEERNQIKQESSVKAAETPTETPTTNAFSRTISASNKKIEIPHSLTPDTKRVSMAGDFRGLSIGNGNSANQTPFGGTVSSVNDSSLENRSSGN